MIIGRQVFFFKLEVVMARYLGGICLVLLCAGAQIAQSRQRVVALGAGQIEYTWQEGDWQDDDNGSDDCNKSAAFTSKLAMTDLSGEGWPNLFRKTTHAHLEYELTVAGETIKIADIVAKDMRFVSHYDVPPFYPSTWAFSIFSARSHNLLGNGRTTSGFYVSDGSLEYVAVDKLIKLKWRSDGNGMQPGPHLAMRGIIRPVDAYHAPYCRITWNDRFK